ncbi:MAG TPA: DUF6152 family protein, partial [Bryobacteraceae bacterium]|nr:DUF6152 family protein [Bryobacteraceae bacterium]
MLAAAAGILLDLAPVWAQTSFTARYDSSRQIELKGAVTKIAWVNPRAFLFIDVRDSAGTVTNWAVDFGDLLDLENHGWTRDSLHIGDVVSVNGVPARGDVKQAFAKSVILARTGKRLFTVPSTRRTSSAFPPSPRWPDGQIRLGPPPGEKGYWGAASAQTLVENTGAKIAMNSDGLLHNLSDADRVAPFKPWAKALYEYRQRTL